MMKGSAYPALSCTLTGKVAAGDHKRRVRGSIMAGDGLGMLHGILALGSRGNRLAPATSCASRGDGGGRMLKLGTDR